MRRWYCRAGSGLALLMAVTAAQGASERYECLIQPMSEAALSAGVRGVLTAVNVDRGDAVKAGQVVAELNSDLERATVALAEARAASEADVRQGRVRLDFALRQRARIEDLFEKNAIPESNLDEAETDVMLAELALTVAQEQRRLARLEEARAEAALELRLVRAPFDGVVVDRHMSPGELVEREPVMTVASIDPLRVDAVLPVEALGTVLRGGRALVEPEAPVGGVHEAMVTIVDEVVDAASGTFGVRMRLPNPDRALKGGLKCDVRFEGS